MVKEEIFSSEDRNVIVSGLMFTGYTVHKTDSHAATDSAIALFDLKDLPESTRQNIKNVCQGDIKDTDMVRLGFNHEWGVSMYLYHADANEWYTGSDVDHDPVLIDINASIVSPKTRL